MKKFADKVRLSGAVAALILAPAGAFFWGCKTVPAATEVPVHPLELLDGGSSFYFSLSPKADSELTNRIIDRYFTGNSGKAALSRIRQVYAGFYHSRRAGYVQAAASGTLPESTGMLFPKRNGWKAETLVMPAGAENAAERAYRYYKNGGVEVAVPSRTIACLAPDVSRLVRRYDTVQRGGSVTDGPNLSAENWEWFTADAPEIRFYAGNPQSFLTALTGGTLNLQLAYVRGALTADPKNPDSYLVSIEFEFRDQRMLTVGQAMLSLAFGLANGSTIQKSATTVSITQVKIKKEQLYRLFSL